MTSFFDEKLQFYKVEYSKKTISRLFITPPPSAGKKVAPWRTWHLLYGSLRTPVNVAAIVPLRSAQYNEFLVIHCTKNNFPKWDEIFEFSHC